MAWDPPAPAGLSSTIIAFGPPASLLPLAMLPEPPAPETVLSARILGLKKCAIAKPAKVNAAMRATGHHKPRLDPGFRVSFDMLNYFAMPAGPSHHSLSYNLLPSHKAVGKRGQHASLCYIHSQ